MDMQETAAAILVFGEQQQRLGDAATVAGLNERAAVYYLRAKVARDEHMLLQSVAEVSDPEFCRDHQKLIADAAQYDMVKWCDYTPERC
jgi:phosphoserine phosphatase